MTIFLENREEQIGGEGTWLIGSGSTEFACKAYFAWNRVDCHVRCTIPVKGGPITPLKQWRGSVRISRFRKLTAVRFDANKNAATIQRTADGSFSSNCWPVTISFNDYSPAVSYILAYPRFIYIEQFTNSLFFFFSPPQHTFMINPLPNVRVKTSRIAVKKRIALISSREIKTIQGGGEKKEKKRKRTKRRRACAKKGEGEKNQRYKERKGWAKGGKRQRAVVERKEWKRKKVVGDDNGIPRNVISIASVIDQATRSEYGNWYRQGWTTVPTSAMSDVSRPVSILCPKIFSLLPSSGTRR